MKVKAVFMGLVSICLLSACQKQEDDQLKDPVELMMPQQGASGQELDMALEWNYVSGSARYDVYLGKTPDDLQLIAADYDRYDPYNHNNRFKVYKLDISGLAFNTEYFWKVRAKMHGKFIDSPTGSFTTTNQLLSFNFQNEKLTIYPADYLCKPPSDVVNLGSVNVAFSMTDGRANTDLLVKEIDKYGANAGIFLAAKFCNELNAYGYSDWYLPSATELDSLASHYLVKKAYRKSFFSSTQDQNSFNGYYMLNLWDDSYYFSTYRTLDSAYCRCVRKD